MGGEEGMGRGVGGGGGEGGREEGWGHCTGCKRPRELGPVEFGRGVV